MWPSNYAIACLELAFARLSLHHFYPSRRAFILIAHALGMGGERYVFQSLWIGMSRDWTARAVIVLTAILTIVLPAMQLLLQSLSLYTGVVVFDALAIDILREKIPETFEPAMEDTH